MNKVLIGVLFTWICLTMTGCGHSGMAYMKGRMFNTGYNPQTNAIGFQWMDGESVMIGSKENTSLEIEMSDGTGATGSSNTEKGAGVEVSTIAKIKYSTGFQVNGYVVDLAEANPDLATAILTELVKKGQVTKYYLVQSGKLVEVTKEQYDNAKVGSTRAVIDPNSNQLSAEVVKEPTVVNK